MPYQECLHWPAASDVHLGGPLGAAVAASRTGRLSTFIVDEHSPAIAIFDPDRVAGNEEGDWYGEHAGKWLAAAARAAARDRDAALTAQVTRVADWLCARQASDGYLGNYAPPRRFTVPQPPRPHTWDGAPALRTWDIWTHSYLVLGLVEAHRQFGHARWLEAACRIGDLCWQALTTGGIDITSLGNHHGMSATVLMDPALELYFATGEPRYLALAERILEQANRHGPLALLPKALEGADASEIATGKAYQLAWNLVGLAKLYRATGHADYLAAVEHLWRNIRDHHLSLGGGPWGGVGHRSREVFNPAGVFAPQAYVETCSTLAWIQLNRELLRITGEAQYADEIERSAYNDLLGAMAPDGEDWCYYSFPNGQRVHTTYWRCCKSSGAMALEELPMVAYALHVEGGVAVNLYGQGEALLVVPGAGRVYLRQHTGYPFDGQVMLHVDPPEPAAFAVRLRIPAWAFGATVRVNGAPVGTAVEPGRYLVLQREWAPGDVVALHLPLQARVHVRSQRNVQESRAPDGSPVAQQVLRHDYLALSRGPLAYATGLVDGYKSDETIRLPPGGAGNAGWLRELADREEGSGAPALELSPPGRAPLRYTPYYLTGGRQDGAWRVTWLSVAPAHLEAGASPTTADPRDAAP